jgi:two-component sensor histidine kinase
VFDPTFRGTEVVRSDDIRKDPRYGKSAPHYGMPEGHLPVVSYLAVPVIGRSGEVLGGLFFGHHQPGVFTQAREDIALGIASHAAIAIGNARLLRAAQEELAQRRKAEETMQLLLHEIQHRVKNTLATVLGVAAQTFKTAPAAEREAFTARIHALAAAHALLTQSHWDRAEIGEVVKQALEPFGVPDRERFEVEGPAIDLEAGKALTLSLILHELGTNAVKYGALSRDTGTVRLHWELAQGSDSSAVRMIWQEEGGPPVEPPARKGFGSTLIEKALSGNQGEVRLRFEATGLVCELKIVLS